MLTLYDNPFSPFARKVRMALNYKGLVHCSVDALSTDQLPALRTVNTRGEVPVLVDGEVIVIDSADIVAYLDDLVPEPSLLPASLSQRAKARHWHRVADRTFDAIIHDMTLWTWPTLRRSDQPPEGLIEAGRADLTAALHALENTMNQGGYICDSISIADFAVFPHITSLRSVGIELDQARYPRLREWLRIMRDLEPVSKDMASVRLAASRLFSGEPRYEAERVIWRGDRIEWLLARGFDEWWATERATGRAIIPAPGV